MMDRIDLAGIVVLGMLAFSLLLLCVSILLIILNQLGIL